MDFMIFFYLLYFSLSHCDRYINFNGTSFFFSFYIYSDTTICINSTKDDWSFLMNDGIQNFNITAYYRDNEDMAKISKNTEEDFLGFHIFGSNSSIELKSNVRSILSFAIASFDSDCDIRIMSNLMRDNITSADWLSPEFSNKKLCYFNGLCYKNHFIKKKKTSVTSLFHNSDGSIYPWFSDEFDSTTNHPPILELGYDKNSHITIVSEDFSKMNHGRSVLILNSTNRKTAIFTGVPYDLSVCHFYDFAEELKNIYILKLTISLLGSAVAVICIVYIVTYCFCCPCCTYYRPQCLYRFGLKLENDSNDQNSNENGDSNSYPNIQQPIYYVYQQHVSQTPEIAQQIAENQQPLMTTNPPPGIYEPVRVPAPIVPVTIVNDESLE